VRHATDEDLDRLEHLLVELRACPQLRERKRGYFSRDSHAFLHFHAHGDDFYVDANFDKAFERVRVTSRREQTAFVARVRWTLDSNA
jgi:hypothetical protein